jgi:hypothetical protein
MSFLFSKDRDSSRSPDKNTFGAIPLRKNQKIKMNTFLATVDLSGVTGELSSTSTAIVAGAAIVATAALAVGAVYFGGKSLWRFFKSLAS